MNVNKDKNIPMKLFIHAKFCLAMFLLVNFLVACNEQGNSNPIEEVENPVDSELPTIQARSEVMEEVSLSQDINFGRQYRLVD